jgi:hypothetical protein
MKVAGAGRVGFGIGIGEPSATRDEPMTNRPRWHCSSVKEKNGATRTIEVHTPRIRLVSFRECMAPPIEQSEYCSLCQGLPHRNAARHDTVTESGNSSNAVKRKSPGAYSDAATAGYTVPLLPQEMSSRSASVSASRERRRAAGGMPPRGNNTPRIELCHLPWTRPVSCNDWPAFHRRQISVFCVGESLERFCWLINTIIKRRPIRWCCIDLSNAPRLSSTTSLARTKGAIYDAINAKRRPPNTAS